MVASMQLTFSIPSKIMSEYYKIIEKMNVLDMLILHSGCAIFPPSRRLVRAMWLCRGLSQAWHCLSAAKGVEESKSKIKNGISKK